MDVETFHFFQLRTVKWHETRCVHSPIVQLGLMFTFVSGQNSRLIHELSRSFPRPDLSMKTSIAMGNCCMLSFTRFRLTYTLKKYEYFLNFKLFKVNFNKKKQVYSNLCGTMRRWSCSKKKNPHKMKIHRKNQLKMPLFVNLKSSRVELDVKG